MSKHSRLADLQSAMQRESVDLVALGPGAHMQWMLGFHPHADERPCLLLVGREKSAFLMPALNAEGSRAHTDVPFHEWPDDTGPNKALHSALAAVTPKGVAQVVIDETMRADFALLLLDSLPDAHHSFTDGTVGELRMRKQADEYALLKANALFNDEALLAGMAAIRPGITELEVAEVIRGHYRSGAAEPLFTIVAAGGNGAFPHHQTGRQKLQKGDAVVMDIGGGRDGFVSDMTRMAIVGEAPEGYEEVHAVVEQAVCAALAAARPGVQACAVDAAARQVIADAGYGQYFVHRTGHGLGIEVHEPPYITSTSTTVLDVGMVFSIEPGIYLPGRFGIRLEDIVILRDDGPEVLSGLPRDARLIAA